MWMKASPHSKVGNEMRCHERLLPQAQNTTRIMWGPAGRTIFGSMHRSHWLASRLCQRSKNSGRYVPTAASIPLDLSATSGPSKHDCMFPRQTPDSRHPAIDGNFARSDALFPSSNFQVQIPLFQYLIHVHVIRVNLTWTGQDLPSRACQRTQHPRPRTQTDTWATFGSWEVTHTNSCRTLTLTPGLALQLASPFQLAACALTLHTLFHPSPASCGWFPAFLSASRASFLYSTGHRG